MFYISLVTALFPYLTSSSSEDPLQITGPSDVADMNDCVVESDISLLELGFAKTQAKKISR